MELEALFKITYGLYIISAKEGDKLNGCVVNTFLQVANTPVKVAVTISKDNYTHDMIARTGLFTASILPMKDDVKTIASFGFRSGKDTDKYEGFSYGLDEKGLPYLTEAVSFISAKVFAAVDVGTHTTFYGEAYDGKVLSDAEPITYTYYRQVKNGKTPKAAPSYHEEASPKKGFRCTVCGYIHEADELPPDFVCPICKKPASVFVKL